GHLVDLGPAPDADPGAVADLCFVPDAAALLVERTDAADRRRTRRAGRAGCSAGLLFHLVLSHAASVAGHRWRRFARSPHGACAVDQLGRLQRLRVFGVLVAVSPGSAAARGGRDTGAGIADGTFRPDEDLTMNANPYLYAAYIVTWVIHIGYLG